MSASQLAVVLIAELAAGLLLAVVFFALYARLRRAQRLVEQKRAAREATLRHNHETGAALRASIEREAVILSHIDEIVFRLRPEGGQWITDFVSARVTDVLGYSADEMIALGAAVIHPDDLDALVRNTNDAFTQSGTRTFRYRIRHQNGDYRWFENRVRAVPPVNGEGATLFGVARDITDQLSCEDALRASREELQQAQKMEAFGRLAGGVAHDFNNLLTTMSGNASMVIDQLAPDDPRREPLLEIVLTSKRAQRFTRQLLAFSRRQVLETEPIDLGDVVSSMQLMLARMIGPEYRLEASVSGKMPLVAADRGQIEQIVMTLVVNARDAMPDGGAIHVRTRASKPGEPILARKGGRLHAVLEVEDSGGGIASELRERIFEPFFTTKERGMGTGHGLSVIDGFVRQSGGEIDLASSPDRGSCFRIYLPAMGVEQAHDAAVATAVATPADALPTVLVVDDEPGVRHLASAMLRRAGYTVMEAADGLEAQRLAETHEGAIDVLLTDIVMPGARGPEVAERLRTIRPTIRVIYMSGFRDSSPLRDVERGEALFVQKPFLRSALLDALRRTV
jgi:two-component system, cell cycle sensor histidine kinase and response regulator CckA